MNLIVCSRPCVYQAEGYCRLEQPATVSDCKTCDCMYFVDKQSDKQKGAALSSPLSPPQTPR